MTVFLMIVTGLWLLCFVARVIGLKATMALVWTAFAVFVLAVAWAIYDEHGGVSGVFAALCFLALVGLFILNDCSQHQ